MPPKGWKKSRTCRICKKVLTDEDHDNVVLMGSDKPYYPDAYHHTCIFAYVQRMVDEGKWK